MDFYDIPMSGISDDEPDEDIIIRPSVGEELKLTRLGSNIPIPPQSDMPGLLPTPRL